MIYEGGKLPWKQIVAIGICVEVIMNPISFIVHKSEKLVVKLNLVVDLTGAQIFDILIDNLSNTLS